MSRWAVHVILLLALPPLLPGIINKTKAWFAGRTGAPLLQPWYDIIKLLRKGAVFSRTTTGIFQAGPVISVAAILGAGLLTPLSSGAAPLAFPGDVVLFAYLLALARFVTIIAALDTGSSFEGMGASREAAFSALTEPALFLALAILCLPVGTPTFQDAWNALPWATWGAAHPEYLAAALALFIVLLSENSRIPFDDPNTHLELTMIHEVMVLDHGGPDLGLILYGGALKFFVLSALIVHLVVPIPAAGGWAGIVLFCAGSVAIALLVSVVESVMARLRLLRVPQLLVGATAIAFIGLMAHFFRGRP